MCERILVLAPHADDGELGCGGTIARKIEEGHTVFSVCFSICEESVPDGYPKDILETEYGNAVQVLGVKKENQIVKKYKVRNFTSVRQQILEDLVMLRREINPSVIFMPCGNSLHQDHKTIYEEGLRAFKHYTCYGYDLPWDTVQFSTTAFFQLEHHHLEAKWNAIVKYETQNFRSYVDKNFIFGLARVRGAQVATKYAEAFETIRIIN